MQSLCRNKIDLLCHKFVISVSKTFACCSEFVLYWILDPSSVIHSNRIYLINFIENLFILLLMVAIYSNFWSTSILRSSNVQSARVKNFSERKTKKEQQMRCQSSIVAQNTDRSKLHFNATSYATALSKN